MTSSERAAVIAGAPRAAVWRVLLDGRRWSEWNPGVQWMVVEGELAPGALLTMKPKGAPQTAFRIEQAVAERRLALVLTFGPLAALRLAWTLDDAAGGTRIEQTVSTEGPAAGLLLKKAAARIAGGMAANLTRLGERAASPA